MRGCGAGEPLRTRAKRGAPGYAAASPQGRSSGMPLHAPMALHLVSALGCVALKVMLSTLFASAASDVSIRSPTFFMVRDRYDQAADPSPTQWEFETRTGCLRSHMCCSIVCNAAIVRGQEWCLPSIKGGFEPRRPY